jgi:iron complex outermembrane receptor protein
MKRAFSLPAWLLLPAAVHAQLAATPSPSPADDGADGRPAVRLEKVEIRGRAPSDTDQRREATAAKIVVGRDEIERYGDSTLADVVKRLPGVTIGGTPGRGGEIRMRGMGGGYTQILINGERAAGGLSVENLTPEQVERIEVYRAPTAETGAQAIAGTINIVLREDVRRRLNTVQLGLGWADDRWQPTASWTRADRLGTFSYNLSANAFRRDRADTHDLHREALPLDGSPAVYVRDEQRRGRGLREGVHLGGRLQWKPDADNTFSLQPFMMVHSERDLQGTSLVQTSGTATAPYDTSTTHNRGHFAMARTTAEWQLRLPDTARLEANLGLTASESTSDSRRGETLGGADSRTLQTASDAQERWRSTRGKYSRWFGTDHQLAAGWELEQALRDEVLDTDQRRLLPGAVSTFSRDSLRAEALRTAFWAQDEWKVSPQWSVHGGLRWEQIRTTSEWFDTTQWQSSRNRSAVWSPLFHALWRPQEDSKDQVRLSLTRSYRAARPGQLTAQRVYSRDADVGLANTPDSPDRVGNPALRPELSTGLDLAYEHYLPAGGLLSASLFHRQISDYIRNVIFLDGTGRYVTQPQNVGNARTQGLELEAKFRPAELWRTLDWPLDLRAAVSFFRSKVDAVPGPDNRLDRQPNYTLNLGADYKLRSLPLQLGGSLSLQPSTALQVTSQQRSVDGMRRVFDAYALWTLDASTALRLSAGNLWARSTVSEAVYTSPTTAYRTRGVEDNTTLVSLRLEMKL